MQFANPIGLYALLALIPLIILYLMRPKPKNQVIPSLMFLMKDKKNFKKYSFLRKLLRNLLFFLQLLILALLALSVASPYLITTHDIAADNTIIILDVSASMQTKHGLKTRFDNAIEIARQNLKGKISIILAENTPLVILEKGSRDKAVSLLNNLQPKATTTNLGDALLLVNDIVQEEKGRVLVISDFLADEGPDLIVTKRSLTSKGVVVDFYDVSNKAKNIGIVNLEVDKFQTKVYIKNFNDAKQTVSVKLVKDAVTIHKKSLELGPDSVESLEFETPVGVSTVQLDVDDDLAVDNVAYISTPLKKQVTVLFITNLKKSFLLSALQASKEVKLEISNPPIIPQLEHDVVVISNVQKDNLLPGTFEDLSVYVRDGGNLIITLQDDLKEINTLGLLPVDLIDVRNKTSHGCVKILGEVFPREMFETEPCFAILNKYSRALPKNGTINFMTVENEGSPLLSLQKIGNGMVAYYGIFDDFSDFKSMNFYPVFWRNLLKHLVQTEEVSDYNSRSGKITVIREQSVKTPTSFVTTSRLIMDDVGIYEFDGRAVAVNLLSEKESDVSAKEKSSIFESGEFVQPAVKETTALNLEVIFLVIAFILMSLEIMYIKFRGDL
jgi:hypothetical protein